MDGIVDVLAGGLTNFTDDFVVIGIDYLSDVSRATPLSPNQKL